MPNEFGDPSTDKFGKSLFEIDGNRPLVMAELVEVVGFKGVLAGEELLEKAPKGEKYYIIEEHVLDLNIFYEGRRLSETVPEKAIWDVLVGGDAGEHMSWHASDESREYRARMESRFRDLNEGVARLEHVLQEISQSSRPSTIPDHGSGSRAIVRGREVCWTSCSQKGYTAT